MIFRSTAYTTYFLKIKFLEFVRVMLLQYYNRALRGVIACAPLIFCSYPYNY